MNKNTGVDPRGRGLSPSLSGVDPRGRGFKSSLSGVDPGGRGHNPSLSGVDPRDRCLIKKQNISSPLTCKYSILWGASVTER